MSGGIGPAIGDLLHPIGALVEQAPDALVAVQVGQRREDLGPEGERMAPPVLVPAYGQRSLAAAREQLRDSAAANAGLVAEHQHEDLGTAGRATASAAAIEDEQPSP